MDYIIVILSINIHKCLYFNMQYYLNITFINSPNLESYLTSSKVNEYNKIIFEFKYQNNFIH